MHDCSNQSLQLLENYYLLKEMLLFLLKNIGNDGERPSFGEVRGPQPGQGAHSYTTDIQTTAHSII